MDYNSLYSAANKAVLKIDSQSLPHVSADVLTSIKNQMMFIRDHAAAGKNPSQELPQNTKFTYAILASRELASPDELVLKNLLDEVTKILIQK